MCPLVSAPNRGYADYQRTSNYDTQPLFNQVVGPQNTQFTSGILDVSRHAYLGGRITPNGGDFSVQITWFADAAGTVVLNWRTFQITPNIAGNATLHLPNLGPFVQLQLSSTAGANYTATIVLIGTNRVHPLEFIPRNPLLVDQQATGIGASGNVLVYPSDYYAGPISVWCSNQFASGNLNLQAVNTAGAWDIIDQRIKAAATGDTYVMVAPAGAWRFLVSNTSAAASTFYLSVTPSTTGAS